MKNATQIESGFYRWVIMVLWMVAHVTGWVVVLSIGILLPSIAEEFQLSYDMQGLLASGPLWANTVLYIPLSIWFGGCRPKILTSVTLVIGILLVFAQASTSSFVVLLASRFVFGITLAAREPARMILMQHWFSSRDFLWVNAVTACILSSGYVLATLTTPYFLNVFDGDWRPTLYLFGGFSAGLTSLWIILARDRRFTEDLSNSTRFTGNNWKILLHHKELWLAGVGLFAVNITGSMMTAFYPTLMLDRYHFPLESSALVVSANWGFTGIAGLIVGKFDTDWRTRARILYTCGLILPVTYTLFFFSDSLPILLALSIVNGMGWSFFPILLTMSLHLPGIQIKEVPIAHAFLFTAISLGMASGPTIGGFALEMLDSSGIVWVIMSLAPVAVIFSGIAVKRLKVYEDS